LAGKRFGKLTVVSGEIIAPKDGRKGRSRILVECQCGVRSVKEYTSVVRGKAGCRSCGQPQRVPLWLYHRAQSAQQRCCNPKDRRYADYGGRGIEFRFDTVMAMAMWVQSNLGLHKDLYLDRKDNDGHYEPGNLRYLTNKQNLCNTRKPRISAAMHAFRQAHPEIRYADSTLLGFLRSGMTWESIVERYHLPSPKPKGVYGTYSTPDPVIASLHQDFS
jgi:hypothetical protein